MAAYKLLDFKDIVDAVMEELKLQSSDTTSKNRIKRAINMIYLDEVVPASRWNWLYGHTKLRQKAYYSAATCSVTPGSATVTLASAPTASYGESGSFLNYKFAVDGDSEVYVISAHTALSTTVTLSTEYNGELDAAATYRIWQDWVALPTGCRETIDVYHEHMTRPMEAKGLQEFNRVSSENPKLEGRPYYYSTQDWYDPSSGDGMTESDRYRIVKFFPAVSQYATILSVDYIKEASALENDGDEPLMPIEDRIVLFYGALSLAWHSLGRNPEAAANSRMLFDRKLALMMGKIQDSLDKPRVEPSSTYVATLRGNRIKGLSRRGMAAGTGGSSSSAPSYLADVTINGATVTGNVTVSSGITVDGRDLSVDGGVLDAHVAASDDVHGIGGTASVVGTDSTQTLTNKTLDAASNTITGLTNTNIDAAAAIDRSKLASGTASVILANDGSGVMSETAITASELNYLDDVEALTSATLTDNTAVPAALASWAVASFDSLVLTYSLKRGAANKETGVITLATDGTDVAIGQSGSGLGSLGVNLTADISAGNIRLLYDTTSTGTNATIKYKVHKWLA